MPKQKSSKLTYEDIVTQYLENVPAEHLLTTRVYGDVISYLDGLQSHVHGMLEESPTHCPSLYCHKLSLTEKEKDNQATEKRKMKNIFKNAGRESLWNHCMHVVEKYPQANTNAKKKIVKAEKLNVDPLPLKEWCQQPNTDIHMQTIHSVKGALGKILVDRSNPHSEALKPKTLPEENFIDICVEGTNWLTIPADRNAVVFAVDPITGKPEDLPRLIVCRNVITDQSVKNFCVDTVASETGTRRNVRPNHQGTMVQFGKNAGPRHVQVFGIATSIVNRHKYTNDETYDKDLRTLGVLSYAHNKFLTCFPKEVIDKHCREMEECGLEPVAAEGIPEGSGYSMILDEMEYCFSKSERTPPEGYLTYNYSAPVHMDKCVTTYSYSIMYGKVPDQTFSSHNTRMNTAAIPPSGGDYVDMELRTRIEFPEGTIIGYQSDRPHGTTAVHQRRSHGSCSTNSHHISAARVAGANGRLRRDAHANQLQNT